MTSSGIHAGGTGATPEGRTAERYRGRVTIPQETRRASGVNAGDSQPARRASGVNAGDSQGD